MTVALPSVFLSRVKYQAEMERAEMICPHARMNSEVQYQQKSKYKKAYL